MVESYVFDLGEKKIEIELVRTKVFCRYCERLNNKCLKKHRSAVIWFIRAKAEDLSKNYIVSDGEIPPEFHEEFGIEFGIYTTSGGWVVPKEIKRMSKEEFEEYIKKIESVPTKYDLQCLIHRLLGKHKRIVAPISVTKYLILTLLADLEIPPKDITKPELTWLRKVYSKWLDDSKEYYDTYNIAIKRIPKSFRETIKFYVFNIELKNGKYKTIVENYNYNANVFKIYRKDNHSRNLIAVYVDYSVFKKSLFFYDINGEWHGMEKYFKHMHPECKLHPICIEKLLFEMIHQRLGDLLFLDHLPKYQSYIPQVIRPANEQHIKKVTLVNARIEEVEEHNNTLLKIIPENKELSIQIIHPEHGCIELYPQEYYIYQVPYIRPGHD